MSNDSHLFKMYDELLSQEGQLKGNRFIVGEDLYLPLYEAKMIHHYDHRWATYAQNGEDTRDMTVEEKQNPDILPLPRYWVEAKEVYLRTSPLPKSFLEAIKKLREGTIDKELMALALAQLLFVKWLMEHYEGANDASQHIYQAWCEFTKAQPFAASIAPTRLGLCEDSTMSAMLAGDAASLPAEPVNKVVNTPSKTTAWYGVKIEVIEMIMQIIDPHLQLLDTVKKCLDTTEAVEQSYLLLENSVPKFLMSFRGIGRATDERTIIATSYPLSGVGNSLPVLGFEVNSSRNILLQANLSALVFDFVSRQKVGGINLNFYLIKQLPVLSPDQYTQADLDYILPRVLELGYTAYDMKPWAEELGYEGEPFGWNEERRLQLKCELDAYYAHLYDLTRDELRYILDPSDIMGEEFPSVTFPGLKRKDMEKYGEFRTQRLVLEMYDKLARERE